MRKLKKGEGRTFVAGRGVNTHLKPNFVKRPQGYSSWLLEATLSGTARINHGERYRIVGEQSLFLYRPGTSQDYSMNAKDNEWVHIWVVFTPRAEWVSTLNWPEFYPGAHVLEIPDKAMTVQVHQLFKQLLSFYHSHMARNRDFAMNILEQILLWCDSFNPKSDNAFLDERLRRVMNLISDSYQRTYGLDELASHAGLSTSRFAHLFKEQVGISPMQYLEKHRMRIAGEYLLHSDRTISEVASEVGYENPIYFSQLFRKHFDKSPRQYRKALSAG